MIVSSGLSALLEAAVARIVEGGVVAYPTETLYGLGADAAWDMAVEGLLAWKGRASTQPLTILVEGPAALEAFGITLPALGRKLVDAFWPGPLTLVLPSRGGFATGVGRDDGAVGVRCSSHPVAAALAARLAREGVVITSTSLNRTGAPPARTRNEARTLLGAGSAAPLLVDDEAAPEPSGLASSVVDVTAETPRLLRVGAVTRAALERVLGTALQQEVEVTA